MDLFEYNANKQLKTDAPLAARMRPETLDDFVGQKHMVDKDKLLYRAIQADKLSSLILYGPPGTGKTTLAKIIANATQSRFEQINATTSGVKEIKDTIAKAKDAIGMSGRKTILFIDEIHRFNKTQQDTLLPHVEAGTVILIGATTENPYFEVNRALISRSIVFELQPLSCQDIEALLRRALEDSDKGLGMFPIHMEPEALSFLAQTANGDARAALNALELAALTTDKNEEGFIEISLSTAQECIQKRALQYDKSGDNHYDTISAFIKSIRGSDPDAALYYLAKMIYAGEDPKFIARRIIVSSAEDIGNADPHALQVAVAAARAVEFIGMPEGRIPLAQAVTYLACAPKSNASYLGINLALEDVKAMQIKQIPSHLRDPSAGSSQIGHGVGYQYAHDYPGHYVKQQYLPDELVGKHYYEPTENGVEKKIKQSLERLRNGSNGKPQEDPNSK